MSEKDLNPIEGNEEVAEEIAEVADDVVEETTESVDVATEDVAEETLEETEQPAEEITEKIAEDGEEETAESAEADVVVQKPALIRRIFRSPAFSAFLLIALVAAIGFYLWFHVFRNVPTEAPGANEVVAIVGDQDIYAYEVRYYCNMGYDIDTAIDLMAEHKRIMQLAEEHDIKLTKEERTKMEENYDRNVSEYGEQFEEALKSMGLTGPQFKKMNEELVVYSKVIEKLPELNLVEGFTSKEVKEYYDQNFLRAKHVLIGLTDKDGKDRSEEEALAIAQDVYGRLKAGENIDELIATYSDDPGSETEKDGYVFIDTSKVDADTKSTLSASGLVMVDAFTQATAALEIGGISEPVKTDYGYHVILRLDINENKELFKANQGDVFIAMSYVFSEEYEAANTAFLDSLKKKYEIKKEHDVIDGLMIEMYKKEHDPANQQMPTYY